MEDESYAIKPLAGKSGLYYEQIGTLKLYNDKWKFLIYLDLEDLRLQYQHISNLYIRMQDFCSQLEGKDVDTTTCKTYIPVMSSTTNNIKIRNELIRELLGGNKQNVQKRGAVNIVGGAAKFLFGILDEDDARYYDEQIQVLNENEQHLQKLMEMQTSVFESSLEQLNSNLKMLKRVNEHENQINYLVDLMKNLTNQEQKDKFLNDSLFHLDQMFAIFSLLVEQYSNAQNNLVEIIMSALNGKVHPYVLNTKSLLNELIKIQSHLPDGINLPIPAKPEFIDLFYKILEANVFFIGDKLSFLLLIPLTSSQHFDIFKMTTIPNFIANNTFAFEIPRKELLMMDNSRQHHFLYSESELKQCIPTFENQYACEQNFPISINHIHSGCEVNLYLTMSDMPKSCEIHVMELHHSIFLTLAKPNSWMYVVPQSEPITINCKALRKKESLTAVGIISLAKTCEAQTKDIILISKNNKNNFKSNLTVEYISDVNTYHEIFKHIDKTLIQNVSDHAELSSNHYNPDLKKISVKLNKLKQMQNISIKTVRPQKSHFYTMYSIITIVIIFIVLNFFVRNRETLWFCCKLKTHSNPNVSMTNILEDTGNVASATDPESAQIAISSIDVNEISTNPRYCFQN